MGLGKANNLNGFLPPTHSIGQEEKKMKKLALNFSVASDGPPRKDLKKKEGRVMERLIKLFSV